MTIQDPTLQEMRAALMVAGLYGECGPVTEHDPATVDSDDAGDLDPDAEAAMYFFAVDYHGGQDSNLYSAHCMSPYRPGPCSTLESEGELAQLCYAELQRVFAGVDPESPAARLEYLRRELRAERISQGELMELESLAGFIDPDDAELLEAAGVPESPENGRQLYQALVGLLQLAHPGLAVVELEPNLQAAINAAESALAAARGE